MKNKELTHVDDSGKASMVNVGDKPMQKRIARASGRIFLSKQTILLIQQNQMAKGDVLAVSRIAGIQAAKMTSGLIPLCHPLQLSYISVEPSLSDDSVIITSEVHCTGQTGVEMEALTGVSAALLTVYDMMKWADTAMVIDNVARAYNGLRSVPERHERIRDLPAALLARAKASGSGDMDPVL